jgi:hypothetical protein
MMTISRKERLMPDDPTVPGILFHIGGSPRFPVHDGRGEDVSPLLPDSATAADELLVPASAFAAFRAYLLNCLPRVPANPAIEDNVRAWILHRALTIEVDAVFAGQVASARAACSRSHARWAAKVPRGQAAIRCLRIATASSSAHASRRRHTQ